MTGSPRRRKTQAERSAETRARLLSAAIDCLHTHGYAASTTILVAEKAGVSRGAMLHQFPTRVDMMLFVVRSVFDQEIALYGQALKDLRGPERRRVDTTLVVWDVLSRPSGVAVLEIMIGARSDPVLAEKLSELQAKIEKDSFAFMAQFKEQFGELVSPAAVRLVHWTIRGLSIANVLTTRPQEIRDSLDLLRRILDTYRRQERLAARDAESGAAQASSKVRKLRR